MIQIQACPDCVMAIANDDYTGMDDARAMEVQSGIWGLISDTKDRAVHYLVIGDDIGFTGHRCGVCGSLPGDMHACYIMPLPALVQPTL